METQDILQIVSGSLWLLFILNLLFSWIVAYAAKQKGRSSGGFFALSFFLSFLIALMVLIAVPSRSQKSELVSDIDTPDSKQPGSLPTMVKCPFCAETILFEAKICKHCKTDVSENLARLRQDLEKEAELIHQQEMERQEKLLIQAQQEELSRKLKAAEFKKTPAYKIRQGLFALIGLAIIVFVGYQGYLSLPPTSDQVLEKWHSKVASTLLEETSPRYFENNQMTISLNLDNDGATMTISQKRVPSFSANWRGTTDWNEESTLFIADLLAQQLIGTTVSGLNSNEVHEFADGYSVQRYGTVEQTIIIRWNP